MRGRVARSAVALGSAGLVVLSMAGCQQSKPQEDTAQTNLKIVEQVQIDENGAEVKAAEGATPADPAGDGKANCPPVSIAMAGALNGPDAALGINIKNGVQLAIDKHNAANPGCQVQLKPFDTEGDPQKATADRAADRRRPVHHRPGRPGVLRRDQGHRRRLRPGRTGRRHGVGDEPHAEPATAGPTFFRGLANDARAGPVGRQLHEEHARLQEGLRRRRQHRLRPRPGQGDPRHPRPDRRLDVQHLGQEGRQGLLRRGDPGQGRSPRTRCSTAATTPRRRRSSSSSGTAASPARSSAPTAPRTRSSSSRPVSRPRTRSCPARAARHRRVRRRVQEEVQHRRPAPTAPRATTWARSCSRASTPASHHPARAARLRQELQRSGRGPQVPVDTTLVS